ncbi:MAG: DUF4199 domain-containing protein [Alistipes sp.]|jgi:cytochrome c oxidase assembly factor CtaG|nr:DUF4199 domain-containing protein [Alistipes sp.]
MTKNEFWKSASRWGLILGLALFVMSLVSWALKLEQNKTTWAVELLKFLVICPAILYTGVRNARLGGPAGYPYGQAVGYIFAMMMFAGIVYGIGRFLMVNFIARDYYDAINEAALAEAMQKLQGSPMAEQMGMMTRMMTNPIVLLLSGILEMVVKGGFLGLILAAFFKKNPDIFAARADVVN